MQVITYLGFTLLSILIQFSVMVYLQDDENKGGDRNLSNTKSRLNDLGFMPHALYYKSPKNNEMENNDVNKIYKNTSMSNNQQLSADTSTIFDIFLYENNSNTESVFTTDFEYTTIGFDNITEVTLFVNKNETSEDKTLSIKNDFYCNCNLLYKVCDINCCCDSDCDNSHKNMFNCMSTHKESRSNQISNFCISHLLHSRGNILDNMFCIVKTNLPEYRNIIQHNDVNITADGQYFKWQESGQRKYLKEFSKIQYSIGDPVWLLQDASINYISLPISTVNKYCAVRKSITFLKDEAITCIIEYRNLEFFRILKTAENSTIISVTNVTANSTEALNCNNLHCTNWTIIVCDGASCVTYDKNLHEPVCDEHTCTNVALNIDYYFYYYDSRIGNVSVIFHVRNISSGLLFISQRINVKFILGNKTDERIIEFSGSPGYKRGLILVASFGESNYTNNFYQSKLTKEKYLSLPININGQCVLPNSKQQFIQFGLNKRFKCRYFHNYNLPNNNVKLCEYIQGNISELFRLNDKIAISPYGNPYNLKDEEWIHLHLDSMDDKSVYGKFDTMLYCYNVISKISLTFTFMNVNHEENNTITSLKVAISTRNISFTTLEKISTIVTTDINFVNISKRPIVKYAGSPHLNINIPKDFFFSYPSNKCNKNNNLMSDMLYFILYFFANKITFP